MTRKFKKGDRVEVVDEDCAMERSACVRNGDIGTVLSEEKKVGDYEVLMDGDPTRIPWWIPARALKRITNDN